MREIITRWTGSGGMSGLTVMYFGLLNSADEQRAALADLWTSCTSVLNSATEWTIDTVGRSLDQQTGTLVTEWEDPTVHTGVGDPASQFALANQSSLLLRWGTGEVVNGRLLKGRTFVPGLGSAVSVTGDVDQAKVAPVIAGAAAFIAANVDFSVWHRPTNGVGGLKHAATSSSVWTEFAAQRGRRG